MKKYGTIAVGVLVVLAVCFTAWTLWEVKSKNKIAYIELATVFNDFEMTKQYKQKLDVVVVARKSITDSLELNLKARSRGIKTTAKPSDKSVDDFEFDREYYVEKVKQFQEDNVALKQQYDGEINKQLNQYVKEYGDKNGYRFIFGAEGSGFLMYAREQENISKEVLAYINERYKGYGK